MVDDIVRSLGYLTLGTRMRRIGERLQGDTQKIIEESGTAVLASQYPFLAAIDRSGPLTVGELAEAVGITQPGVTRTVAQLVDEGLLRTDQAAEDQRRRIVSLTPRGERLVADAKREIWPLIRAAVEDLCGQLHGPLLGQLAAIEDGLDQSPLRQRAMKGRGRA